jgi:hypothetical protein
MKYMYELTEELVEQASSLQEFANGGAQCHAELHDGLVYPGLLISNAKAIIAMRGHQFLPFSVESIAKLFQQEEDIQPNQRGGWYFFDGWVKA